MKHPTREALAKLLDDTGGLYSVDDIVCGISTGKFQSWVASDGTWMITQIIDFPRKRVVESMFTIGSIQGALEIQPRVVEFAKEVGASRVQGYGRPGWDATWRARPEWKKVSHFYVMEL